MTIRLYRPEDRPAVEAICAETGARGRLEEVFCDKELFPKLWLAPYLDTEPQHCWVAEDEGRIVGYLVSSLIPGFERRALRALLPHLATLVRRWASGKYRHHPASGRFVRWMLLRSWREKPRHPKDASHPHFNVTATHQGSGAGDRLLAAYFAAMRERGIREFYGIVFSSSDRRAVSRYERIGFRGYDLRRTTLLPEESWFACVVREVPPGDRLDKPARPDHPAISVVVPAHNEAGQLGALLKSLDGQLLRDFEVVVVADNCTDATAEIAEKAGAKVVVGCYGCAAAARNAGIQAARGEIIVLQDADTTCPADYLWQVRQAVREGYAYGAPRLASTGRALPYRLWVAGQNLCSVLFGVHYGTGLFATREALRHVGLYDGGLKWGEDAEMALALRNAGRRKFLRCWLPYSDRKFRQNGPFRETAQRIWMTCVSTPLVLRALARRAKVRV